MTVEIISRSISTKVWDRGGIELATPGIAVRHASVARHVTDCATRPGKKKYFEDYNQMSCTSSDLDKNPAKFQNDPAKTVGGVAFTRYPASKCFKPKFTKSELLKK